MAALLLLCSIAGTTSASSVNRWVEVRSQHFVVLTNSNEKNARRIALQFERMRSVFHALFPTASSDTDAPITVLALKDRKSFQAVEPADYLGKGKLDLSGVFLRSPDRNYILLRLDTEGDHPYSIVYHEYTHYLLRHDADWLPVWLNEGLAEFYENTEIDEKTVRLGEPSEEDIVLLRQRSLMPLTTLFQVDHSSPYYHEQDKWSIFYAESWALTHYLMLSDGKNNTHRIREYSELLTQHEDPIAAAQQAFGDLKALQKSLNAYVQQSTFQLYKMKTPAGIDPASFQVVPIATSDVDAVRADVLFCVGRTSDAEALLHSVLQANPNSAMAHETMGMMKFRQGDLAGAIQWFGQAVALNSDSYLAHYYYAALLMRSGASGQDSAIESGLRAAIKLNPDFAPSYDALASFYGSRHENFDEAHRLNLKAIMLDPDNVNYRMDTAAVLMENRQFASALDVLQLAEKLAKTEAERESIGVRIDQIEKYQAEMAEAEKQSAQMKSAPPAGTVTGSSPVAPKDLASNTTIHPVLIVKFKYPTGAPTGPSHTVQGTLQNVQCAYPSVITLNVEAPGEKVFLYSNDFAKIDFKAANYTPQGKLHPCTQLEGRKARVRYGEVSDKSVDGQIESVMLSK
ncbi:MAG: tetratricopeptide repeat protein [Acidobacteriaceae bacterium]